MTKVFIDGSAGTTGLRIHERLADRADITLITLPDAQRKDPAARKEALCSADIAFLCLPDAAAIEAASMAQDSGVTLIDTSTAHRVHPDWAYGFPELTGRREQIANASRIANPGCHASGFLALSEPLVTAGLLKPDTRLSCFSLTGYSGGGKKMIADYEATDRDPLLSAPRQYALSQQHKHLPEMAAIAGLTHAPVFCPIVADYYSGMEVTIPLSTADLTGSIEQVKEVYRQRYAEGIVHFAENADESGFLSAAAFSGRDDMQITVTGHDDRLLLIARFDNLGKGASGAAIQNMNIRLGLPETTGLVV